MQAEKKTGTGADEKASKTEEEVKVFDGDFVKVDQGTLFELILVRPHITPAIMTSKPNNVVGPSLHLAGSFSKRSALAMAVSCWAHVGVEAGHCSFSFCAGRAQRSDICCRSVSSVANMT